MTQRYLEMMFSAEVKAAQSVRGSLGLYDRPGGSTGPDRLTESEAAFITARDSFYMATNGADGWPYLQHRGGARGFVHVQSPGTLAFADFRGNRQYISLGNSAADTRTSLFFMDYVNRARLKLLGRLSVVTPGDAPAVMAALDDRQRSRVERVFIVAVEAFDWNCPQYIAPRYTADDIAPALHRLQSRIAELEGEVAGLRAAL